MFPLTLTLYLMSTALFIGRFQPLHLGHLTVIKKALKENERLIIGIGSAEDNFLSENPFTAGERFEMIEAVLKAEKIDPARYVIIPVRNIDNYALWVSHVSLLTPPFQKVYTGSSLVKELFQAQRKYQIIDIKKELKISSTEIRKKMLKGDRSWEKLVPPAVSKKIEELDGITRLKNIKLHND